MKKVTSLALGLAGLLTASLFSAQLPPAQAASGPGGRDYPHGNVRSAVYASGDLEHWIFEPIEPEPATAPVVVFFHGWSAMDPAIYAGWIEHLVRRGAIVIFPRYQASLVTPPDAFTPNAMKALEMALDELSRPGHVDPDPSRFATVGHSAGGMLAANYAAVAADYGLPVPRAVLSAEPGKSWGVPEWAEIRLVDLSAIPADTLLISLAGDLDTVALDVDAKRIFYEAKQVPLANKDYVLVRTDDYGWPDLFADHGAPASPGQVGSQASGSLDGGRGPRLVTRDRPKSPSAGWSFSDALDFYGFWKLFDGLMDAAFYGTNREFALGDTPQQRHMGVWSDGRPVRELVVSDQP
jgi:acetyl esterase/lipase